MSLDMSDRLKAIQETVNNALSYVGQHGKAGIWSYDLMREALIEIDQLTGLSNGFAEDMADDKEKEEE